ncbi:hypothetical protein PIB30_002879 [Stylosanthes scabra]|uniref:Uncharacterized protein n=1 Tax=Stylosanthes scabra TaxID=79078 RepID=A0ABU6U523_9FABA|nr:hypothetical protein [Stylosanthes scabra]
MPYTPASIVAVPRSYEVHHGSMAQVLGNLRVTLGSRELKHELQATPAPYTPSARDKGLSKLQLTKVPASSGRVNDYQAFLVYHLEEGTLEIRYGRRFSRGKIWTMVHRRNDESYIHDDARAIGWQGDDLPPEIASEMNALGSGPVASQIRPSSDNPGLLSLP